MAALDSTKTLAGSLASPLWGQFARTRTKINGRGGRIRTDDHQSPRLVRYQAALRPDNDFRESRPHRDRPRLGAGDSSRCFPCSATQDLQHFLQLHAHLAHDLVGNARLDPRLRAFQALARTSDRETLVVQQRPDLPDHQHVVALVVTAISTPFDGLEVGKLLFPIAQHVRLDRTELADLPDGEIAFCRDDRKFAIAALIQHRLRPGPSVSVPDGTSPPAARKSESPRRSLGYALDADS